MNIQISWGTVCLLFACLAGARGDEAVKELWLVGNDSSAQIRLGTLTVHESQRAVFTLDGVTYHGTAERSGLRIRALAPTDPGERAAQGRQGVTQSLSWIGGKAAPARLSEAPLRMTLKCQGAAIRVRLFNRSGSLVWRAEGQDVAQLPAVEKDVLLGRIKRPFEASSVFEERLEARRGLDRAALKSSDWLQHTALARRLSARLITLLAQGELAGAPPTLFPQSVSADLEETRRDFSRALRLAVENKSLSKRQIVIKYILKAIEAIRQLPTSFSGIDTPGASPLDPAVEALLGDLEFCLKVHREKELSKGRPTLWRKYPITFKPPSTSPPRPAWSAKKKWRWKVNHAVRRLQSADLDMFRAAATKRLVGR